MKPDAKAEPAPEAKAEVKPEVKAEPKPEAKSTPRDLTPKLVERVHALYEELGRQDVIAVQELEKAKRVNQRMRPPIGEPVRSALGHAQHRTDATPLIQQ